MAAFASAQAVPVGPSANLIVIMADDLEYADVGFNGCKDIPTPRIDSIAANGVKCTGGYLSYAVRSGDSKLVIEGKGSKPVLFNLADDIGERKDLAESSTAEREALDKNAPCMGRPVDSSCFEGLPSKNKPGPAKR